jgi:hypothetical protein
MLFFFGFVIFKILLMELCSHVSIDVSGRIQAWWRGIRARARFLQLRDAIAPSDPALRRRFVARKV